MPCAVGVSRTILFSAGSAFWAQLGVLPDVYLTGLIPAGLAKGLGVHLHPPSSSWLSYGSAWRPIGTLSGVEVISTGLAEDTLHGSMQ